LFQRTFGFNVGGSGILRTVSGILGGGAVARRIAGFGGAILLRTGSMTGGGSTAGSSEIISGSGAGDGSGNATIAGLFRGLSTAAACGFPSFGRRDGVTVRVK
jgi:hypothetical protein